MARLSEVLDSIYLNKRGNEQILDCWAYYRVTSLCGCFERKPDLTQGLKVSTGSSDCNQSGVFVSGVLAQHYPAPHPIGGNPVQRLACVPTLVAAVLHLECHGIPDPRDCASPVHSLSQRLGQSFDLED